MKTVNEFYGECLAEFVKKAQGYGYANSGARSDEVLAKRAEQSVRELLKYKGLINLFGNDQKTYYYYINGLSFAMGIVLATLQRTSKEKFEERGLIPAIVNDPDTSAHDLAYQTMAQYGMSSELYNQLVQDLYNAFVELDEPHWKSKEARDYTISALCASFMVGCSMAIECFEMKAAQAQMNNLQ